MTLRAFADGVRGALPGASIEVGPGLDYMGPGFVYGVLDARSHAMSSGSSPTQIRPAARGGLPRRSADVQRREPGPAGKTASPRSHAMYTGSA